MSAMTTHYRRLVQGGAGARSLRQAAGLILLFNGLLVAWLLLKPANHALVTLVDDGAQFLGPLLVLPLCFLGLKRTEGRDAPRGDAPPGSTRATERALQPAVLVLGLALIVVVVTDSIYDYQSLHNTYATGTLLDVGWPLGIMLLGLGAFAARLAMTGQAAMVAPTPDGTPSGAVSPAVPPVWRSLLP
jgi:hypothetical protein